MDTVRIAAGGGGRVTYTVSREGGCLLIDGAIPIGDFAALAKTVPDDAVVCHDLARMAGVTFAAGLPADVAAMKEKLTPSVIEAQRCAARGYDLSEQAIRWLACGRRGRSSNAIFKRLTGFPKYLMFEGAEDTNPHPNDPADFVRCRLLLEQVPEFAPRIGEMADVSPVWGRLIGAWGELCALMDEECPDWRQGGWSVPRTYRRMRELVGE